MKKLLFELRMRKVSALRSVIICALFVIIGVSSIVLMASFAAPNLDNSTSTNVTTDTVFVNDLESDYYYYTGLNYTTITNNNLPAHADRYNDNNLVKVFITYSGVDISDSTLVGHVSRTETQYEYRYYKYYPKNNGYIEIELPDNLFTSRPDGKGFNGWATSDTNATILLDKQTYTRTARINVGNNTNYSITFNASWTTANVVNTTGNIATLPDYGMQQVPTKNVLGPVHTGDERRYFPRADRTLYEEAIPVGINTRVTGYVCEANNFNQCYYRNNEQCGIRNNGNRCSYYSQFTDPYRLESDGVLYDFINNGNNVYRRSDAGFWDGNYYTNANNPTVVPIVQDQVIGQAIDLPNNSSAIALFYRTSLDGNNRHLYYDATGLRCDQGGNCGGNVYKLIQTNDNADIKTVRTALPDSITNVDQWQINNAGWLYGSWGANLTDPANYYYLVTRDMNILQIDNDESDIRDTITNKPLTVTASAFGRNTSHYLNNTHGSITAINTDYALENIQINSGMNSQVSETIQTNSSISANRHNLKIGRNVTSYADGQFTFYGVMGTNASSNTNSRFKVIVESGVFDYLLSNGSTFNNTYNDHTANGTLNNTMQGTFIYGSDYDRANNDNSKLILTYCAYASNNGGISGPNDTTPASLIIVKSGSYGKGANGTTYDTNYSHGIYVGSRGAVNVSDSALRSLIVEGGDINVINGGPLVNEGYYNRNVVSLYMKGGRVRSIFGGAGQSATGGNRIISVTSGTVTNNVFGGSNAYNGSNADGFLNGNTLVYIGGNAVIGDSSTVLFGAGYNPTSPAPGDVFGAGNGRSGNNYVNVGSVNNSTVIIDGGTIRGSVYGGGNYGSVGLQSWSSSTDIQLLGGTVEGSVYGGGNNAGGGQNRDYTVAAGETPPITVNITLDGGNVETGIYGGSNTSGTLRGNVNINLLSNTVDPNTSSTTKVYGGGRGQNTVVEGNTKVEVNAASDGDLNLNEVYGGSAFGTVNSKTNAKTTVNLNHGTVAGVYGGGEGTATIEPVNAGDITVNINNGTYTEVFGGNNKNGTPAKAVTVNVNGGNITRVLGGNNEGGSVTESAVYYLGANVSEGVYGCGKGTGTSCGATNVFINNENTHMTAAYGGGYAASVTSSANVLMLKGEIDDIFGGSNTAGQVARTNVYISGGSPLNVFGGNNAGGRTVSANVNIGGSNLENVYGGGKNAETTNTFVRHYAGYTKNLYGGGLNGGVSGTATVNVLGGIVTKTFGGSNSAGVVNNSDVIIDAQTDSIVYDDEEEYNGEEQQELVNYDVTITFKLNETQATHDDNGGCWYGFSGACDRRSATRMTVIIENNMDEALEEYKIYIDGDNVYIAPTGSNYNWLWHVIKYDDQKGKYYIDEDYADYVINGNWSGDHSTTQTIPAHSTVTFGGDFWIFSDDEDPSSMVQNLVTYTDAGDVTVSYEYPTYEPTTMIIRDVYGGNNAGGNTVNAKVTATNGYASYVYGGSKGTGATATNTEVHLDGGEIINVYGGGDEAVTTGDTHVEIVDGYVKNLFGGGNGTPATVQGDTYVIVDGGETGNNVYGGGNQAVTEGNTTVSLIDGVINGSLFGSGDAAETGTENSPSVSTVNILAGTVNGNVYGGANFSRVYGRTDVNIGENTVSDTTLSDYITANNITYNKAITINGTVYGGGEAKSPTNTEYNFDYISVTQGIEIDIDAQNYTMVFDGSVFGSGNASSSAGISNITIKNLGTTSNIVDIESIQRATNVKIINSNIQIFGAKDSTNKYSNNFTLNRIDHFYLLNNSSIYLRDGANVLKEFNSGLINNNDEFVKEAVTINDSGNITSQNVSNRLYMWPNKTLNVLTDEELNPAYAGIVNGMCFLGLYLPNGDGSMKHGIYDTSLANNATVSNEVAELMIYSGTSVYGKHKTNHDIEVDGYWSYFLDEDTNKVNIDYVDTTPKNSNYYIWAVGVQVKTYEINLYASRYSTLGVKNLSLTGFESPNTIFMVEAFQYENLNAGVDIIDKNSVPKVANSSSDANSKFGLSMGTSDTGWMSNEETDFFKGRPSFSGSTTYQTESSSATPTLSFYLYNSKNIELNDDELQRELGYTSVILTAITHDPDDPLTNFVVTVEVRVNLFLQKQTDDGYGSVIAPGKKYSVFPYMAANISSNGSVSIYQNLFLDLEKNDSQGEQWSVQKLYPSGSYRALISELVYPVGTTITMIDLTNNEYYYYTVTPSNIGAKQSELASTNGREVSYYLRDFIKMDSTSSGNHYNDSSSNNRYYNASSNSAFEEFIFTVDFSNANVTNPATSKLYLELRRSDGRTIMSPLPSQGDRMKFSLFTDANTQLITTGTLSSDTLYVGESITLNLDTEYRQAVDPVTEQTLYDTAYDDYQLGSTITFFDSNGLQLDDQSLLGVVININGTNYYAQTDGTYRVNLAGKVATVSSVVTIDTASSNMPSGEYTMRIDTFGSYDGLYSGEMKNEPLIIPLHVLNNKYGLLVESSNEAITHDKTTGEDVNGEREISFSITTSSGQDNPNLRVRLERRTYDNETTYGDLTYEYETVDFEDVFEDELTVANANSKLYYVTQDLPEEIPFTLTVKEGPLTTGTYRIVFGIYDGDNYIGSVYRYLIIRDMK